MELIVGGVCQGKQKFAREMFPQAVWTDGRDCTLEELLRADGVYCFHEFIGRMMDQGRDTEELPRRILEENPDVVIVCDEVGYGVVPVSPRDRAFREAVGRVCCELAARAARVYRVVCGTGMVIKDA